MLFSHTNPMFEIATMTFAVSFAVNEHSRCSVEHLNQALEPIKPSLRLVSSQIPPSASQRQVGSLFMKRLPTLLYEHTSLAVFAHIAVVRAKQRAKRQVSEDIYVLNHIYYPFY